MELTQEQYAKIEKHLPKQRGNVKIDSLQFLNAILHVAENGCKWRALPKEYGKWHTMYMRMNRWSKNGVLDRSGKQAIGRSRHIFTRYDKLDIVFAGFILLSMIIDSLM